MPRTWTHTHTLSPWRVATASSAASSSTALATRGVSSPRSYVTSVSVSSAAAPPSARGTAC
eukprot:326530-Chlamydomonas_euryale.AAC.1